MKDWAIQSTKVDAKVIFMLLLLFVAVAVAIALFTQSVSKISMLQIDLCPFFVILFTLLLTLCLICCAMLCVCVCLRQRKRKNEFIIFFAWHLIGKVRDHFHIFNIHICDSHVFPVFCYIFPTEKLVTKPSVRSICCYRLPGRLFTVAIRLALLWSGKLLEFYAYMMFPFRITQMSLCCVWSTLVPF